MKAIIICLAMTFAACNSVHSNANSTTTTPAPTPTAVAHQADGVERVTTAELEKLLKEGKAIVVDVRSKAMYDLGHIAGAKLIPVPEIEARANELPRDKMIVTYCS
jgi:3-mercaptopyruvate sulfurtransferase SseA